MAAALAMVSKTCGTQYHVGDSPQDTIPSLPSRKTMPQGG
jgi:hypothetical protein